MNATSDQGLRRIALSGLLAGLCPLIPIPFVDDLIRMWVRRRLIRSLFSTFGQPISNTHLKILVRGEPIRLAGCLWAMLKYLLKKIFRKLLYFLSMKDALDEASALLHEGFLVRHALVRGFVDATWSDPEHWNSLARALKVTCATVETRPLNQMLRLFQAGQAGRAVFFDSAYLRNLEGHFARNLESELAALQLTASPLPPAPPPLDD